MTTRTMKQYSATSPSRNDQWSGKTLLRAVRAKSRGPEPVVDPPSQPLGDHPIPFPGPSSARPDPRSRCRTSGLVPSPRLRNPSSSEFSSGHDRRSRRVGQDNRDHVCDISATGRSRTDCETRGLPLASVVVTADAVVIGAGPNGLVAAIDLADRGWDVVVLEAAAQPGGAVRSAESVEPGFTTDLFSAFYPLPVGERVGSAVVICLPAHRRRHRGPIRPRRRLEHARRDERIVDRMSGSASAARRRRP